MMIQQISDSEYRLTSGQHQMTLTRASFGGWYVATNNSATRAAYYTRNLGSCRHFWTLTEVEKHYKSWRGVSALIA